MSTYNGEKYLAEQLDSILAQEGVHVELFVRDDGSSDSTKDILRKYASSHENIHLTFGENMGAARSFIEALKAAPKYEYYALSDQDDVWEKDKLDIAVSSILQNSGKHPVIYASNMYDTDENLNVIRKLPRDRFKHNLEAVILRRNLYGCTMVFTPEIYEFFRQAGYIPEAVLRYYHDSLIASVCCCLGGVIIFDKEAHIFRRMHTNNETGDYRAYLPIVRRIVTEMNIMRWAKGTEPDIARWILQTLDSALPQNVRGTLELIADCKNSLCSRLKFFFSPKFSTGDFRITIWGKVKMLFGLL